MAFLDLQDVAWLPIADAVTKATLLLAIAALASALLRRGSAAARHLVWTLALLSALALPILSVALPRWQLPLLTLDAARLSPDDPADAAAAPLPQRARTGAENTGAAPPLSPGVSRPPPPASTRSVIQTPRSFEGLLLMIWLAGLVAVIARLAVGLIAVHWYAGRTDSAEDAPWIGVARGLAAEIGSSPRVRFLRSARATMPMACGIFRPAIVMPADADTWPRERLRIVLLHELAHVKRRDCLTHVLAQIACALYWFHPLAWVAARRVRTERERACDDLVLATGTRAPDYADQLLEIARGARAGRFPAVLAGASLAMAYRSQLEGRLMAILDPKVPRSGLTRMRASAATALFSLALLPLASVQPWAYVQDGSKPAATVPPDARAAVPHIAGGGTQPAVQDAERRDPQAITEETVEGTTQRIVQGVVQGVVQGTAQGLTTAAVDGVAAAIPVLERELDAEFEQDERARPSDADRAKAADPRTVEALKGALKDSDKDVRQTALHALVQLRDPSIYDVLVEALRDEAPDVRQQAAFGLGRLRDRRSVPALTAALKDTAADVRQQAVFALGQLRDPVAVDALIGTLKDTHADVRQQAAFALGQIRDRGAIEALVIALNDDSNADVRQQAAFALGQLRDARAIEALTAALKDASAGVRQQAAFALGEIAR